MPELLVGDADTFGARLPELLEVYRQAFLDVYEADPVRAARERLSLMRQHRVRPQLRLSYAQDAGAIIGFCYTYRGQTGQWWHDAVRRSLDETLRSAWFANCREVVELHVLPAYQGTGVGRSLLRAALDDTSESTAALSALDLPDSRALRLYRSEGFVPLLDHFRFPGSITRYVIMVKQLAPRPDETTLVRS